MRVKILKSCACGCGAIVPKWKNKFVVSGHSNKNRALTENHRRNIAAALTGNPKVGQSGETNHFFGKKHTEEAKDKNRQAHLGRKWSEEEREHRNANSKPVWNKGIKTGHIPWNKGLTKETDERVAATIVKSTATLQGKSDFFRELAYKQWQDPEHRKKVSEALSGINHAFYRTTGLTPEDIERDYPLDWTDTLREAIRERDGRECRLCNLLEPGNDVRLHVHHIDYDKENLDPLNLVSLCTSCHGKTVVRRSHWTKVFQGMMKLKLRRVS